MAIRKVIVMGNPVLRQIAEAIPERAIKSPEVQSLIQDMIETMFEYDGLGLAAPQIGESVQVVVMIDDFDPEVESKIQVLINPQIEILTQEETTYGEGCLSVPGLRGDVSRPNKIRVRALDEKGKKLDFVAEGFHATVVQHECDHLIGKLYIDRMTDLSRLAFAREYTKFLAAATPTPRDGD